MGEKEIELEQENIIVYSGGGAVNSVNGYTGDVVLTTSDLENTSDYQTGDEVDSAIATAIAGKQDTLTAGANITIDGTTISATDTTYTAGTNVSISEQNVISATDTTYTAGSGLDLTGTTFSVDTDTIATKQSVTDEATARENADIGLQGQIDAISASSDVTDIVGTYAALQAYDTSVLKDNDIIKVLQDEIHDDETTYYRWSTTTETFTLIGEEGPYYTKAATDTLLAAKQDTLTAGANITIEEESGTGDLVISATDTTYSNFTGTDGTTAGIAGLVPAPATTDAGKFLGASGLWEAIQAGGGAKELTSADYNWPTNNPDGVALWLLDQGIYTVKKGTKWYATNVYAYTNDSSTIIVWGESSSLVSIWYTRDNSDVNAIRVNKSSGVVSGSIDKVLTTAFIIDSLTSTSSGLPLSANQGKVLKDLVDSIAIRGAGAPTTSTVGTVGQLYEDGTNGALYQLKSIDITVTPNTYNWEQVGGSSVNVVQTTGTSTTDVMSQNATTSMVYADPGTKKRICIGGNASASLGDGSVAIGENSFAYSNYSVTIGPFAKTYNATAVAIGSNAYANADRSIALGPNSQTSAIGEMNIGSTLTNAYKNTQYRLLSGLYDGQSAHDAVTVGQITPLSDSSAPTTATVGRLGQIFIDTTNADAYMCVAVDSVAPSYTWKKITA